MSSSPARELKGNWAAIALALAAIAGPASAGPAEQRCTALGANCDCSDPLNTTSYTQKLIGGDFYVADFADSEGTGSKDCGKNNYGDGNRYFFEGNHSPQTYFKFPAPTGMPSGNSVSNVLHWTYVPPGDGPSDHGFGRLEVINSSTRRICMRHYEQFSDDYNSHSSKIMMIQASGAEIVQITDGGRNGRIIGIVYGNGGDHDKNFPDVELPQANEPRIFDCTTGSGTWCGIEECIAGNIQAGTNLTVDLHFWTTNGAKNYLKTGISATNSSGNGPITNLEPMMMYRGSSLLGGPALGTRKFSHVMQAHWDTNAGQFIGPAAEVEGGSGGSGGSTGGSTGGTGGTAPVAPVMLP
jgi:hypothetical protein